MSNPFFTESEGPGAVDAQIAAATANNLIDGGTWSSAAAYAVHTVVLYGARLYRCILARSATATTPDADTTHWAALALASLTAPLSIGTPTTPDANADMMIAASAADKKPLVIQLDPAQSQNGIEIQDSSGGVILSVDPIGNLFSLANVSVNAVSAVDYHGAFSGTFSGTFFGDGSNLNNVPPVAYSDPYGGAASAGALWVDNSGSPPLLKMWSGSSWLVGSFA